MPTQQQIDRKRIITTLFVVLSLFASLPFSATSQTVTAQDLILGPQLPIGTSWYDTIQVTRGRFHADNLPAVPPATYSDAYINTQYYDLGLSLYRLHARTSDPADLARARKVVDSWWANSWWINNGTQRLWLQGNVSPPPRHAGIGGLILRALDGRPEMWDWINQYTRFHFDHWVKKRVNDATLFYGLREGAFALHYAIWLAQAHPDATIRAQYLADSEATAVQYYGRLQLTDGSWRWDDPDFTDTDGGKLKGITQPFMVGMLLDALVDLHRISTDETVKANVLNQIAKSCRHLYSGGPYTRQRLAVLNVEARGFHYFYHGGTTVNPTKYEKGNLPADWNPTNPSDVQNARQAIGLIVKAFGYAFAATGDLYFKNAGDDLWDAAYGSTDNIHNYFAGDAKSYNQNSYASSYPAWRGKVVSAPSPTPSVSPSPSPSATPTPTPVPSPTVTPTPTPTPAPCVMTVNDPTLPAWSTGKLIVNLSGLQGGAFDLTATATSGQVWVGPPSAIPLSGTSAIAEFKLQTKKKSASVIVSGPCGSKTVMVNVR